jgi:hypothetical protein
MDLSETTFEDVLSLCLVPSHRVGSLVRLQDCMNTLIAIQETINVEEGGEHSLAETLERVLYFYQRFVPVDPSRNRCRVEILALV